MKMRALPALLLAAQPLAAFAQPLDIPPVRYPAVATAARGAEGFVPAGWAIVGRESGDLNADGRADLALLMQMRDRANILAVPVGDETVAFDTNPHLLAVAFGQADGGYRLAASNRGLFLRPIRPFTGEDALGQETIRIERGGLLVSFGYLRGHASYRFRWQRGAFRLIGFESGGASGGCVETISINYLTRRARVSNVPISSDRTPFSWRAVTGGAPPTLGEIDLEDFIPTTAIAGPSIPCTPPADE
ncbi:MAG TPA: hypothetical protein VD846_04400 [Allosphingosinicella sp.]|nr:hypothetical protein [Allosphingosinicella sp.]